jgi:hypothetical protein
MAILNTSFITNHRIKNRIKNRIIILCSVLFGMALLYITCMFTVGGWTLPWNKPNIDYVNRPFTVSTSYSKTSIESIEIKSVDKYSTYQRLELEVIGTTEGTDAFRIEVKCYDKDGFLLETLSANFSVSAGEKFKAISHSAVPLKTARIEFVKD